MFQHSILSLAFLLVASTTTSVSGRAESVFRVHFPHALKGNYSHVMSTFGGQGEYYGQLSQKIYYFAGENHCRLADSNHGKDVHPPIGNGTLSSPFLALMDRAPGCNAVQQARVAQSAGAAALILVDHACLCADAAQCTETPCTDAPPFLSDDGTGATVQIPVILIKKQDGRKFKKHLTSKKGGMFAELELRFPKTPICEDSCDEDERMHLHFWTTPTDHHSRYLIQELNPVVRSSQTHVKFHPRQYLFSAADGYFHCQGDDDDNKKDPACDLMCTNHGRYCLLPDAHTTGRDGVIETLRRACIHQGTRDAGLETWLTYTEEFGQNCQSKPEHDDKRHRVSRFNDTKCIRSAMTAAKLDYKDVDQCMKDSGGTDDDTVNKLLARELVLAQEFGVSHYPAAVVNGRLMNESPMPGVLAQKMCAELAWESKICNQCAGCAMVDMIGCIRYGSCEAAVKHRADDHAREEAARHHATTEHPFLSFLKWTFLLGLMGGGGYAGWLYRHRNNNHVATRSLWSRNDATQNVMTDYMQVSDGGALLGESDLYDNPTGSMPNMG